MRNIAFLFFFSLSAFFAEAQDSPKFSITGYVTNMQSVMIDSMDGNWINDNLIHNRLNFKYKPAESFSFACDIRNRIFTGETVKYFPSYGKNMSADGGIIDFSESWINENSIVINSAIDRLWFKYEKEKFAITLGRQRINWGRTLVWNPNDIFNSYSFFDFDYAEKPGSDALRVQFYPDEMSTLEAVAKIDSAHNISAAALYRFNFLNYDIQFLSGIISESDFVLGLGWEGNISRVSFRGEMSYIHPKTNFTDTAGLLVASIAFDYVFANSLMIQTEFLYNPQNEKSKLSNFGEYYAASLSVKNLSFTEYNIFVSAGYPATPLLNISLSAMYYPKVNGWYAGPGLTYSLGENLDFSVFVQSFKAEFPDMLSGKPVKQTMSLGFLRLKYNF